MPETSSYRPIDPATLEYDDEGTPFSVTYGDVYHPTAGAAGQARHVFMTGCGLPEGWRGADEFVILETGFGLGHNFLATWEAWRADPQRSRRLHFISVEKHPFGADALAQVHARSGISPDLSRQLCAQWPLPMPGFHTLHFDEGRVTLTLLFGDALEMIPEIRAQIDAIYLDGFAPGKNPDMWSPAVFATIAKLAHSNTRIATWSVSGWVRTCLAEAGFLTDKIPGFGGKREMLSGRAVTATTRRAAPRDRRAIVIGAGLAGSSVAERLAARDWQIQLIDSAPQPAQGASGNIAGAFRPLPSADDGRIFQLTRAGFLYGLRHLQALQAAELRVRWSGCGVLHIARDIEQEAKQRAVVESIRAPQDFVRYVDVAEAGRIAGHAVAFGGWYFPKGGWINPPSLCMANIARYPGLITGRFGQRVARLQRVANLWRAVNETGEVIGEAPVVILANAVDARRLSLADWLPVRGARGQVSHIPAQSVPALKSVVCGQGYVTPAVDGFVPAGATFFADDESTHLRLGDHLENLDKLNRMLPGYAADYPTQQLGGRVGQRPVSPDRVPMVGGVPSVVSGKGYDPVTVPRAPGLNVLTGFGARGLVWCSILGEQLASSIAGSPAPLPYSLSERIDPARFLFRRVRSVAAVPEI
ncbi:bifunctional tRNA (5-methylaminomethyl-2-thiouridine)(34)-methyltransferase MnmD/FAD-dependent 5-carboxymethylaminomethyl-2-thiouridine(34) oxidoreductase MnmC [Niveibacterium sp. SC-1]|uniref:bifunctional tRNA (5-methylaminomethyl-2-thiouridine)(34)-methyltransferase MnmD/FAD-dependent 5-carboxymethylaminomethyl-2-thiouridine(34) oxidoreductase MnmC n=1 Tax=Niveibacterium sp. SC-1 TaxID=3135646 RepID=UPI00311E1F16